MRLVSAVLFILMFLPGVATAADFQVIVSSSNPVSSLDREEVERIFLKKKTRWADGKEIVPVDLTARSEVRAAFCRDILRRKMSVVESFWYQQVFSGQGVPPPVKASDAEVVAFVAANPGAIGYVGAGTAVGSVRVVAVR